MKAGFLIIILLSLFVVSCTTYDTPQIRENYQTGSNGIEVEFFTEITENGVLENSKFDLVVDVHNKGAYYSQEAYVTLETESTYVDVLGEKTKQIDLFGRSNDYPGGELRSLVFPVQAKSLNVGSVEHNTIAFATVCYSYTTELATNVCIDTDPYNREIDIREKVCQRSDVASSSQGGPVAVRAVEVQTYQQNEDIYLPQFVVEVRNLGNGLVFTPNEIRTFCSANNLNDDNVNQLFIEAYLSDVPLQCGADNVVSLLNGEGKIICGLVDSNGQTIPINNQLPTYEAPLHIKLSYGYSDTVSQTFAITRFA